MVIDTNVLDRTVAEEGGLRKRSRNLDDRDIAILRELQANARITNAELARRVHLSPTPCLERVKRLEVEGYIDQYVALLNAEKLSAGFIVFVEVTLKQGSEERFTAFAESVRAIPEVVECHMVANRYDYLLKVRIADMDEHRNMLGRDLLTIRGVTNAHSFVVMEAIKESTGFPLRDVMD